MTNDLEDLLPTRVTEYVADGNHDATSKEVLAAAALNESRRAQVEHYLAVTRYTMFKGDEGVDADGLGWDTVEWADVAEWDVSLDIQPVYDRQRIRWVATGRVHLPLLIHAGGFG